MQMKQLMMVAGLTVLSVGFASAAPQTFWSENFDDVTLNPRVDEGLGGLAEGTPVFNTPGAGPTDGLPGWSFTKNITGGGITEWNGWSVANKDWWVSVAGNQNRSEFTKSTGNALIADPDEFDDKAPGITNAGFNVYGTASVDLSMVKGNDMTLKFDSSWRPEGFDDDDATNNQTAKVRVSYDGGATWVTPLHWDSDAGFPGFTPPSPFYKLDATNESVVLNLTRTAGAQNALIEFSLTQANNDWWWAVDNISLEAELVPEPATMAVLGLGLAAVAARRRRK